MTCYQLIIMLVLVSASLSSEYIASNAMDAVERDINQEEMYNELQNIKSVLADIMDEGEKNSVDEESSLELTTQQSADETNIEYIKIVAVTGTREDSGDADSNDNHELAIFVDGESTPYRAVISGRKDYGSRIEHVFPRKAFNNPLPSNLKRESISGVQIRRSSGRGNWLVASVVTYFAGSDLKFYTLTEDLDRYNLFGSNFALTSYKEPEEGCIHKILIAALTGRGRYHGFPLGQRHTIVFTLVNGSELTASFWKPAFSGKPYATTIGFAGVVTPDCVRVSDIQSVHLESESNYGWYISSLATAVQVGRDSVQTLTQDSRVGSWLDNNDGRPPTIDLCMYKKFAFSLPSI